MHNDPYLRRPGAAPKISRDRFWVLVSQNIAFGLCVGYVAAGFVANTARLIQNFAIIFSGYGQ